MGELEYGPVAAPWRSRGADSLRVRVLASPEDGPGSGVVEVAVPPGGGMPRHTHGASAVLIRVLEGEGALDGAAGPVALRPGAVVRVGAGVPVALRNLGEGSLRLVIIFSPAGFERAFLAWPEAAEEPAVA